MIAKYKDSDFSEMLYPVHSLTPGKSILKEFPDLAKWKEFQVFNTKNEVLRYIMYCFDRKSPLLREPDMNKRKLMALDLAGFKRNKKGVHAEDAMRYAEGKDKFVNKAIVRYIRLLNDQGYTLLITLMNNYFNTIEQVNSTVVMNKDNDLLKDAQARAKLAEELPAMLERIADVAKKVFFGEAHLVSDADAMSQEESLEANTPYAEMYARPT